MTNSFEVTADLRTDILLAGLALSRGFTIETKNPGDSFTFKKGGFSVWRIRDGWQTAELIEGRYFNHQPFNDLAQALDHVFKITQ